MRNTVIGLGCGARLGLSAVLLAGCESSSTKTTTGATATTADTGSCVDPPLTSPITTLAPLEPDGLPEMYIVVYHPPGIVPPGCPEPHALNVCIPASEGLDPDTQAGYLFDIPDLASDCLYPPCISEDRPITVPMSGGGPACAPQRVLPPALERYCIYEPDDSVDKGHPTQDADIRPARKVVAPAGAVPESVFADLRGDYYLPRTELEAGTCADLPPLETEDRAPVRLVFIDASPTGPLADVEGPNEDRHGRTLALGIQDLLCGDAGSTCAVKIRTRMAMGLLNDPTTLEMMWNLEDGGAYGSLDYLAQAIYREVLAWEEDPSNPHLVLTLSLGWHPSWGDLEFPIEETPSDVLAVWDALRYARCRGALIVAAAGNRFGGDKDSGALLPAAWTAVGISADACADDFLVTDSPFVGSKAIFPLLFAAGGVNADGASLTIARDDSEPALVAYSESFLTASLLDKTLGPLTGTSVGAAVVAAAAAKRWSELGETSADTVMADLYGSATPLGRDPALLAASATTPDVRQVVLCISGTRAPVPPPVCSDPASAGKEGCPSWCASAVTPTTDTGAPWPEEASEGYEPATMPQPVGTECEACALQIPTAGAVSGTLYVDASKFSSAVYNVKLATRPPGGSWTTLSLPNGVYHPGVTLSVTGIAANSADAVFLFSSAGTDYFSSVTVIY